LSDGGSGVAAGSLYLSTLNAVDYNKASSTGQFASGARTINQKQYGHSIGMNAGCQNKDGGDFWVDYSIESRWTTLTASVGISDRSSTQSRATARIINAVSGAVLAEKIITAGSAANMTANVSGVVRIRLFINDENAPSQSCGFEKISTAVIWGDAELRQD
jgi:hypothetical protein